MSDARPRRDLTLRWIIAFAVVVLTVGRPAAAAPDLVGTGSGDHLWFVVDADPDDDRVELMHYSRTASGPYARVMKSLPAPPVAMAAWNDRLWLVFVSKGRDGLDVASVRIARHALQDRYHLVPHDRFELEPSLPGGGDLIGFVGTVHGPVALIVPPRATRTLDAGTTLPSVMSPRLLHLRNREWEDVALPDAFNGTEYARLAATGDGGTRLLLLDPVSGRVGDGAVLYEREEDGGWSSWPAPASDGQRHWPRRLIRIGKHAAALVKAEGPDAWQLAYLRREQQIEFASFESPAGDWNVFGLADGPRIAAHKPRDGVSLRHVLPATGTVGEPVTLTPPPFDTRTMLRGPVLFVIVLFALGLIVWLRPGASEPVELPPGTHLLPPSIRLWALLIDMIPGGVVAVLVTGCRPIELLGVPLVALDPNPFLIMAGITVGLSAGLEMMSGTTIGKRLLGARVIGVDGPAGARRCLIRNAVKLVELLVPPLAIIVMMTPNLQGLHDLAARTLVVHTEAAPPEESPER